jgi:SAM-dependent methyltransferase
MQKYLTKRDSCRVCASRKLTEFLDLGSMPPANSFLEQRDLGKPELTFPLKVYFCHNCSLVQLLDVVSPELLFGDYHYLTSASQPLADHFVKMGQELALRFTRSKDDLVVEIGSNDGTLLRAIGDKCRTLGVEPARNVAALAVENGIETINEFFSERIARQILKKYGSAKVVIANNVIAHIDNLHDIFSGAKALTGDGGVFVFEVHWVGNLIGDGGFDQIYHEHLSYFSLSALQRLVEQFGYKIFDAALMPIYGSSLRIYAGNNQKVEKSVEELLSKEKAMELDRLETYMKFSEKVRRIKTELTNLLLQLKREGKKIAGYGAPAKGNTLLNYCGIDNKILDYLIDTTPFKQGKFTPGVHIPIYSPEKLNEAPPDYLLLLAWNYKDVILEKEKTIREKGVRFIIPVPEVKIV